MPAVTLPAVPFYTVETLADEWQCRPDRVRMYLAAGMLQADPVTVAGTTSHVITDAERIRFEHAHNITSKERGLRRDEREILYRLLGFFVVTWAGEDMTKKPFQLFKMIASDMEAQGLSVKISDQCGADKMKQALAAVAKYVDAHKRDERHKLLTEAKTLEGQS